MLKIKWKDVRSKWMEDERPRGVLGSLEGSRLTMGVGETRHGRLPTAPTPNCSPPLHLEEEHWLLRIDGCTVDMSHCTSCTELITRCTSHYALSSSHFAHFWPTHICKLKTNSFLKLLNVLLFTLMTLSYVQVWSQMRCHTLPGRVYTLLHSGHVGHAFNNWHVIRFRVLLTFARVRDLTWVHKICLTPIKSEDLRNNFKIPPRYIQKRNLKDTLIGVVNAWFYSALREHIERHIQERRPFNTLVADNDLNE